MIVTAGVDLSFIVKAVPAVPCDESQEEQTHEVLQASINLFSFLFFGGESDILMYKDM